MTVLLFFLLEMLALVMLLWLVTGIKYVARRKQIRAALEAARRVESA